MCSTNAMMLQRPRQIRKGRGVNVTAGDICDIGRESTPEAGVLQGEFIAL